MLQVEILYFQSKALLLSHLFSLFRIKVHRKAKEGIYFIWFTNMFVHVLGR